MRSAGRVLSRDALMENFYNRKATPFDRSIDMHISHLRKKLEHGEHADQNHPRRRAISSAARRRTRARNENRCSPRSCCGSGATLAITVVGSAFISALS